MRNFYTLFLKKLQVWMVVAAVAYSTVAGAQTNIVIGTGTTGNATTGTAATAYPCPLQDLYEGSRAQYLYRASELAAAGMGIGNITALRFDVASLGTAGVIEEYTVKIGSTTTAALTTAWETTTVTTVFGPVNYQPVAGANILTFSTPFFWNGTDNILVEICNGDATSGNTGVTTNTVNPVINWTAGLPFNASHTYRASNGGNLCATTTATNTGTQTTRPNTTFAWSAVNCTGTITGGTAETPSGVVCPGVNFTVTVSGSTVLNGITYQWQRSPDATTWTNITGETGLSLTTSQPSSNWYRRVATCTGSGSVANSSVVFVNSPILAAGTFTINNAAPTGSGNFATFKEAIDFFRCGISGAVVLNVQPGSGPYTEQITIPQVPGASATNTITINGNGTTLQFAPNTTDRHILRLDGADHVIIDSLHITGTAVDFGWGIHLTNGADSNTIRKCIFDLSAVTSTTQNNSGCIVGSGTTTSVITDGSSSAIRIENNTITGGYQGIIINGGTGAVNAKRNIIRNNIIKDFYSNGIELTDNDSTVIDHNDISRATRTAVGGFTGIEIGSGNIKCRVNGNRIHDTHNNATTQTGLSYGVFLTSADAAAGSENRITNNLIYNFNSGSGLQYALYNLGSDGAHYFHNTVVLDNAGSTAGAVRGFYQTTAATNIRFFNNIIYITRGGTGIKHAIYLNTNTTEFVSNNNVLYINAPAGTNSTGYFNAISYAAIADWKTANSNAFDQVSLADDPAFMNASMGDYQPSAAGINNLGVNVGVPVDINGVTRGASPDPGAYEFGLPACVAPPTAGTAEAGQMAVCPNATVSLNLVGNSAGAGQTYQWQSSDNNTTWTNIGPVSSSSSFSVVQTTTKYYRCVVTCSGNSQNSNPVYVTTTPLVSGTFSINNAAPTGGGNFQSFAEAIASLNCGIGGPVVFDVQAGSGPYNEQVLIYPVTGASAANTVTFNGNGVVVQASPVSANRYLLRLDGADHIIIDSVVFQSQAVDYGWGAHLTNGADSNIIRRCTFDLSTVTSTTQSNSGGIVISGSNTSVVTDGSASFNLFDRNTILGAYQGVITNGLSGSGNVRKNVFSNNIIKDFYAAGMELTGNDSMVVKNNDISRAGRTTTSTTVSGIELGAGNLGSLVDGNRIHDTHNSTTTQSGAAYGIYSNADDATAGAENLVVNNVIYNLNSATGTQYGIYNAGSDGAWYYHNTIVLDYQTSTAGVTRGFYQTTSATNIKFMNNIVYISRGGTGAKYNIYLGTTASGVISNYNNLFLNAAAGTNGIGYYGAGFATLADWKTANTNAFDQASTGIDPMMVNGAAGDFTPTANLVDNSGTPVGVLKDILGVNRSNAAPDPGAYEFSTLTAGINAGAFAVVTPAASAKGCYTNAETISVRIRNFSTGVLNFANTPVTVTADITGPITQTLTTVINTGTLASNGTQDVVFTTPVNMSTPGIYSINAYTAVAGDADPSNNALVNPAIRTRAALFADTALAMPGAFCVTGGIVTLNAPSADGYSSLQWQQSTTSGTGFANISGANVMPYTIAAPISQSMYYRLVVSCGGNSVTTPQTPVIISNPILTSTTPGKVCGPGQVTLTATAAGSAIVNWYDASLGGVPVATGNTFITPVLNASTTYYATASSGGASAITGMAAPLPNPTPGAGLAAFGLVFDALAPFTLQSVVVYPVGTGPGTVTIDVVDANGAVLNTATVNVVGAPTGSVTPQTVQLNFNIAPGNNLKLRPGARGTGISGLQFDPSANAPGGSYAYPFVVPGVVNIKYSTLTAPPANTARPDLYYYFYNWQISTGCEAARVPVLAQVDNDPACTLPVSLLEFGGERAGDENRLYWTTASEVNNKGFELQRSVDGNRFSKLAFIASKALNGNSVRTLSYEFTDADPLPTDGWYRLKQVDKDDRSAYSKQVLIRRKPGIGLITLVYPNPAQNLLKVTVAAPATGTMQLQVTDMTGKVVLTTQVAANSTVTTLNIQPLAAGTYLLKAICADGCEGAVHKFVKQ